MSNSFLDSLDFDVDGGIIDAMPSNEAGNPSIDSASTRGTSGYLDPEVGEVRFLDLMVYRGSAYEVLGEPKTGAQIAIQSKKPALV